MTQIRDLFTVQRASGLRSTVNFIPPRDTRTTAISGSMGKLESQSFFSYSFLFYFDILFLAQFRSEVLI